MNKIYNSDTLNLFKLVSENATDLVAILNDEAKFEYVNSKAYKKLTGYKEEDLIGKTAPDLIHPKDHKKTLKSLKVVFESGENEGETRLKCKDGSYIWVTMKAVRFFGKDGKLKVLIIANEISKPKTVMTRKSEDRFKEMLDNLTEIRFWKFLQPKQAIAAYQESQEMLRLIMDSIPQYIAWKDKNLVYLGCNTNFIKLMGLEDEKDIIGKTDFELGWGEEFAVLSRINDMRVIEKSRPEYHVIESWKHKDKNIWFDINRIPLHNINGNVVGLLVTFDDITDHKKADEALQETVNELKKTNTKLKESEEKYRDLTELLPETIYEADLNFNVNYVNSSGLEKFGYTQDDLNKGLKIFNGFAPEEFQKVKSNLKRLFERKPSEPHEYLMRKKDGTPFYGRIFSAPTYKDGKAVGFRGIIHDITESKLAEQKLKESEEKYRTIFNASPDIIFLTDNNGIILDANQEMVDSLGFPSDKLCGKNILEFYAGDNYEELIKTLKETRSGKELKGLELQTRTITGKILEFDVNSVPLKKNGKVTKVLNFARNITNRKLAEQKLKESEKKYRHLFNSTPYAIWLVNLKGIVIDCNITTNNLLSIYTRDDLIGKNFRDIMKLLILKGDPKLKTLEPIFENRFKQLINGDKLEPFEFNIIRVDGKELWISLESSFVNVGNETLIQVFIKNITERKEADLKIQESEEKYRLISENANDLIFILDNKGRYLYCNETFKRILGYTQKELLGKYGNEITHPDDFNKIVSDFEKALNEGSVINEMRFRCKDGTYKWVESTCNVTYDNDGNPIKLFVVSRDISERKMMEEKLKQSEEELKSLNKELEQKVKERTKELEEKNLELQKLDKIKDEFITHAAHELKTPLISITGYTDYILYKYKNLDTEIKEDLLIVQRNIERLNKLMNQLLDVMKIESHKMELDKELRNVSDIIKNCMNELSYLIKEKNHEAILNIREDIILPVDPERIFQVISNLISNAIKFTPANGKIEISSKKDEVINQYIFEVKDNGVGLSRDELKRLFKKFEMVKQISDESYKKGTGLGLYISKGFIKAHGGKIWASSEGPNKGTTIYFTLPA